VTARGALAAAACLASASATAQQLYGDGRDSWTLFEQKLINRQLDQQLDPRYRLGTQLDPFTVAADVWVGAQVAANAGDLSRFHGFFVGDTFGQARLGSWIDVDLNLTLTNPSASDGYRLSSFVLPGLALHVHHDLFDLGGTPVHFDFVAPDLDLVTTGEGLLVEQLPAEGYRVALAWRDWKVEAIFDGQAYFADDDYTTLQVTALGGRLGAQGTVWDLPSALDPKNGLPDYTSPTKYVGYTGLFGHWPLFEHARVAAEVAARFDRGLARYAGLVRLDWLRRHFDRFDLHVGYQFRYYGKHFTPQLLDEEPHTSPSLPYREEAYVTNAFEYYYLSREYDQWSHTGMLEVRARVWRRLTLVGELEEWLRYVVDPDPLARVAYATPTDRVPGVVPRVYYRAGVEWAFQEQGRFRGMLLLTNKTVNSDLDIAVPVATRFSDATVLLLRFVAKL
jgi:hypothetical protein